jgi:hypothetical protein
VGTRGEEERGKGGVQLDLRPCGEKRRGSAWARWLRTALTVAGGTRLVGAVGAGYEQGRAAGRGRRGTGVTNRRDRGEGGRW